ncbi:hypothetical protein DFH28DRAFT_929089 [Melampsora americana]|nr:hypothetical protein DFH28DRAFT_929089 [Melampsora americana]
MHQSQSGDGLESSQVTRGPRIVAPKACGEPRETKAQDNRAAHRQKNSQRQTWAQRNNKGPKITQGQRERNDQGSAGQSVRRAQRRAGVMCTEVQVYVGAKPGRSLGYRGPKGTKR